MGSRQATFGNTQPTPSSVRHMTVVRERDRGHVNAFLESHHPLGQVPGWLACWSARYADSIVALVVIGRPAARTLDDGTTVSINRYALRDDRPANTGSWLIGQVRPWCRLEGYDRLIAYAGVSGEFGTVYSAAGFECCSVTTADGSGWTNRDDRVEHADYRRRRWEYSLQ